MSLKRLIHLSLSIDGAQLGSGTLNGVQYITCPVVSKLGDNVEWPINAPTPELIPSRVLSLSIADRNNRPVVMGHPQDEFGNYISANDPLILEKYCFGFTFAAKFEDGKVKSEMWVDPTRAALVGPDAVRVIERLKLGQMVEVSEGDYVLSEIEEGEWNGKKYGAKWVACWADHLACLPEGSIGACSIEDGCGALRTSQGLGSQMAYIGVKVSALAQARKPTYTGTESTVWTKPSFADYIKYLFNGNEAPTSISKCSSDLLRRIASHSLLGDPEAKNFQDLTFYPVVNPSTGYLNESALRNVIAGKGSSGLSDSALTSAQEMATRLLNSEFSANLPPKIEVSTDMKNEGLFSRVLKSLSSLPGMIKNSMGTNRLNGKLWDALSQVEPGLYWVEDHDPDTKLVWYTTRITHGSEYYGETEMHLWQRSFNVDANENVIVNDDRQEAEFVGTYKLVTKPAEETTQVSSSHKCECQKGDGSMNRASVVNRLSASGGPFAGNKAALEAMSDSGLEELEKAYPDKVNEPSPNPPITPANPNPPVNTPPATEATTTATETQQTVSISREDYTRLKAASDALEAQIAAKKAQLVASLSTVQAEFTPADLQAMEMATLEKMGKAFKVDQPQAQASYIALPVSGNNNKPALRDLPDPLGLKAHGLRPDGKRVETTN